jgi:hypothetical protein
VKQLLDRVIGGLGAILLVLAIPGAAWVLAGRPEPGEGFFNLVILAEAVVIVGAVAIANMVRAYLVNRRSGMPRATSFTTAFSSARAAFGGRKPA